jgi:hypothetical protein
MLLKTESGGYRSANLTLTFGPGIVRYLDPLSLIADEGRLAIEEISSYGVTPSIKFSTSDLSPTDIGIVTDTYWGNTFKFSEFPSLFEDRPYEKILREVALIFRLYSERPFPSEAYWSFISYTNSTRVAITPFLESWMWDTHEDSDLTRSYADSDAHILLTVGYGSTYVFRKTDYILKRRRAIEASEEEYQRIEEEIKSEDAAHAFDEVMLRSSFEVFTYLMEDTRNGLIKIGKSKNPERREKTLQSEVPSVELRIAVPTESDFESELHREFDHFRRRGEWFALTSAEVKTLIERLLAHGDPERTITSNEWLGRVFLEAFSRDHTNKPTKYKEAQQVGAGDAEEAV